ncbi:DUF4304 domain-containing protein [Reichenbachiella ulvae]|uniref:DUF4304 domain-containing protein n=1 Tax=Reichenbachiella ulvae TaxID=2980104 RepID=A0ABT3CNK2_9BACT|nr:DUF4304 domain-containing protein [Reichenbachiella ulvae]MCV9385103.1 DUF4304 domain-containing protein [Reichenbachiella ulvae]
MKSENYKTLDLFQSILHKEHLKPIGFKKKQRNFNRIVDDEITQVINLQMWQSAPNETEIPGLRPNLSGQFTINLGVYLPIVNSTLSDLPTPKFIAEYTCHIRTRLGELVNSQDEWYSIQPENNELIEELTGKGLDWFSNFSSYERILEYFESTGQLDFNTIGRSKLLAAIIHKHLNNEKKTEELLNSAFYENQGHPFQGYLKEQAERLGIKITSR